MFLLTMTAAAAMAVDLQDCKVEDAVYQQRGGSSITATFIPVNSGPLWPANLALKMHVGATGRSYWWLPWSGGSNGRQNLASTTDVTAAGWRPPAAEAAGARPLGDVGYFGMDASYNILGEMPRRGGLAPAHFHVPDLRSALWNRTPPDRRDAESGQFFDLVSCGNTGAKAR